MVKGICRTTFLQILSSFHFFFKVSTPLRHSSSMSRPDIHKFYFQIFVDAFVFPYILVRSFILRFANTIQVVMSVEQSHRCVPHTFNVQDGSLILLLCCQCYALAYLFFVVHNFCFLFIQRQIFYCPAELNFFNTDIASA